MVGVVSHFKFATPDNRKYKGYIRYMARDEAKRTTVYRDETNFALDDLETTDYDAYNNYMSNPEKTSGLFNQTFNQMPHQAVLALKKQFQFAQKNESNMWQIVVSFDNDWLEKFGAYQAATHELDEVMIINAARAGLQEVLKAGNMESSAIWSGAIHYNTDNIHIHLAIVEPLPSKPKRRYLDKVTGEWHNERPGYLPYKAIDRLKSQVANQIAGRTKERMKFDQLIREDIGNREDLKAHLYASFQLQKRVQALYQFLPSDKRLWKYNNNAMKEVRPQIDAISQYYIDHFHASEFQELKVALATEKGFIKATYGDGKLTKGRYQNYEQTKLHELYSQLGNTILKDLVAYDFEQRTHDGSYYQRTGQTAFSQMPRVNLHALDQMFQKSYEEVCRLREFEQLEWEMEHGL